MSDLRKAAEIALEAMTSFSAGTNKMFEGEFAEEIQALRQALAQPDLARVGEVGVWGQVVECEQHKAVTEDGWCEWVCPKPTGYLMQCCDCELVHEVDFRVVKYEPRPSEAFEVVSDTNLQAQMRLRRRDDISPPKREVWCDCGDGIMPNSGAKCGNCLAAESASREWVGLTRRELDIATLGLEDLGDCYTAIEAKLKEKNA